MNDHLVARLGNDYKYTHGRKVAFVSDNTNSQLPSETIASPLTVPVKTWVIQSKKNS